MSTPSDAEGLDRRHAARLAAIVRSTQDAIVGTDVDGIIESWNPGAERLFGYRADEVIGQSVRILVPDHRVAREGELFRAARAGERIEQYDTGRCRKDGTEVPVSVTLTSLTDETGEVVGLASISRDRSEQQRAGGVAHDLNNLLGAVTNYASFVASEVSAAVAGELDRDWASVLHDIDQIQLATERAAALTRQLLAFDRREVVRPQVLDLNVVVDSLAPMLRRTLGEHIDLVTSKGNDVPRVVADPGQMEQVLVNLVLNARDAMPTGGSLTIDTADVHVDDAFAANWPGLEPGHYVRLRVSDSGAGMAKAVVDRAFEPFFTTKAKGEGTGLGLATVYGIISQAGGHTHIYSEPGVGTTVNALLPATHARVEAHDGPIAAGVDLVEKPFSAPTLLGRVRTALGGP